MCVLLAMQVFVEFPIEILWPQAIIAEQIGVGGGKHGKDAPPPASLFSKAGILERIKNFYLDRHISNVFYEGFVPLTPLTPAQLVVPPVKVSRTELSAHDNSTCAWPVLLLILCVSVWFAR